MKKGVSVVLFNNNSLRSVGALGIIMVAANAAHAGSLAPNGAPKQDRAMDLGRHLLAERSARFVENKGQWAPEARFLAKSAGLNLWYTDHGIRVDQISTSKRRHQAIDMFVVGGRTVRPSGALKTNSRLDVYHGKKSVKNIGSYRELMTKNVLPGVSMRGYFDAGHPRYDLILAPGAKPSSVRFGFHGANGLTVKDGALKVGTGLGGFFNGKPYAYQTVAGKRVPVAARWSVAKNGTAGFVVSHYDPTRPLVIDPLVYGTYFGGEAGPDEVRAAVTDTYGGGTSIVVVGSSSSPDFPATSRPFTDTLNPEGTDAFIARIIPAGTATDFSVLVGGEGTDIAQYLKVDPTTKDLWFAGTTTTTGAGDTVTFPANVVIGTNGSDDGPTSNIFVGRFTHRRDGSLTFGGSDVDATDPARNVVVFGNGQALVQGQPPVSLTGFDMIRRVDTKALEFAFTGVTENELPQEFISGTDDGTADVYDFPDHHCGFLVRFDFVPSSDAQTPGTFTVNPNGSQYITGSYVNEARGVALDTIGEAYVAGTVFQGSPPNVDTSVRPDVFYTTGGAFDTNSTTVLPRILRATDAFVRVYGVDSSSPGVTATSGTGSILFSGLLGGNGDDEAGGAAASVSLVQIGDDGGNPPKPFYASIPVYTGNAVAIDIDRNIYVTGTTRAASNFPHTIGAYGGGFAPAGGDRDLLSSDIFVARFHRLGTRLDYAANLKTGGQLTGALSTGSNGVMDPIFAPDAFPTIPTTAMPGSIAVDSQGYVYLTGNLRDGASVQTNGAVAALDTAYTVPAATPTTVEGFLTVLKPDFSALQFSTYVGGSLDDMVFGLAFDSAGNILLSGWTDGARRIMNATVFSNLPGFIGSTYVKGDSDPDPTLLIPDYGTFPPPLPGTPPPSTSSLMVGRDGFVASVNGGVPALAPVTLSLAFSPSTIDPKGTATGTISLGTVRNFDTTVEVDLTTLYPGRVSVSYVPAGSSTAVNGRVFNPNAPVNDTLPFRFYVTIPAGSLSTTFSTSSVYYGNGLSPTFTAYQVGQVSVNGTLGRLGPASSPTSVTIKPLAFSLALNPATNSLGQQIAGQEVAKITLTSPAPLVLANLSFAVTVQNTAANQALFPSAAPYKPTGSLASAPKNYLLVAAVTVNASSSVTSPSGQSLNFTLPTTPGTIPFTAFLDTANNSSNGIVAFDDIVSAGSSLTILPTPPPAPVKVLSIVPNPTSVRSSTNTAVTFTVTFESHPTSPYSFTVSPSSVFPGLATATVGGDSGTATVYTVTAYPAHVTRTQDVSVTVHNSTSTASASCTVTVLR